MKSTKIVIVSDAHLEHSHSKSSNNYVLDAIVSACVDSPAALVIAGDLFDTHGIIESSLSFVVKTALTKIANQGTKVVLVAGNHDYKVVTPEHYGKSGIWSVFSGLEAEGIFVIDRHARYIKVAVDKDGQDVVVLGVPYRENEAGFADLFSTIPSKPENSKIVVAWHVGIPIAADFAGDEPENGFANPDNVHCQRLFSEAHDNHVFLGHYHTPKTMDFGGLGAFTYVGSPATRSRTESSQVKRIMVWQDGDRNIIETGLTLDYVAADVKDAASHVAKMVGRFGESVKSVLRISILLKEATVEAIDEARDWAGKSGVATAKIENTASYASKILGSEFDRKDRDKAMVEAVIAKDHDKETAARLLKLLSKVASIT